jgi:hypothetical protein
MRKVTDLKPNEAILISNDAERDAISKLFDKSGLLWANGEKVSNWISGYNYPYAFELVNSKVYHSTESDFLEQGFTIHPAADFIGSEGESVEADKKVMITINLSMDKDTAFRIGNVLKQHEPEIWELLKQEIKETEIKLTRNTPKNERN